MINAQPTDQAVRRPRFRWIVLVTIVLGLSVTLVLTLQGQAATTEELSEMLRFNHNKHVTAGVNCVYCHPGVLNGPVASIPSVAKCIGCHQSVQVESPEGQSQVEVLLELWDAGQPLRWQKYNDQPDFVHFSHQPHIAAGVNCENCHGNVSEMSLARPAYRINMGFCLNCHRQQDQQKIERLVGCATCHK